VPSSKLPFLTKLTRTTRGLTLFTKPTYRSTQNKAFSMAWRSSGTTNESLIANLERNKLIETDRVKQAMLKVSTIKY
jgi:hypothetical protein